MARKPTRPKDSQDATPKKPARAPLDKPVRIDEYIDDAYDVAELDAMDVPSALEDEDVLNEIAASGDGIEEVDVLDVVGDETVDTGYRRHHRDVADMGLGAEPHSAEELEEAALGEEARHSRGVMRDDEMHGRGLLDRA